MYCVDTNAAEGQAAKHAKVKEIVHPLQYSLINLDCNACM